MVVWIVNDMLTSIPGTRTLWHDLVSWSGGHFIGGDYSHLADIVRAAYEAAPEKPDVIVRNATYFPPLGLPVPTISLIQDIISSDMQEAVVNTSSHVVYNSEYTRVHVPCAAPSSVIPLPVDFDLFKIYPSAVDFDVAWVGAQTPIKGWDVLRGVMESAPDLRFLLVLKDDRAEYLPGNARAWLRLPHDKLVGLINSAQVGLCTSRVETQHLAGLEMGSCGLPLVATRVGAYYNRPMGVWGRTVELDEKGIVAALRAELDEPRLRNEVRGYWLSRGFRPEDCRAAWTKLIAEVAA